MRNNIKKSLAIVLGLTFVFTFLFSGIVFGADSGGTDSDTNALWQENYEDFMGSGFDTADGSAHEKFIDATVDGKVPRAAGSPLGGTAIGMPIIPSTLKTTRTSPLLFLG